RDNQDFASPPAVCNKLARGTPHTFGLYLIGREDDPMTFSGGERSRSALANPWLQLIAGIACMVMIANLQYGWTLFVNPIDAKFHWGRTAIQIAFSIFVLTETWLVPVEGWFVDRYGPKIVVMLGGLLVGIAWVLNAFASSLTVLYVAAAIG